MGMAYRWCVLPFVVFTCLFVIYLTLPFLRRFAKKLELLLFFLVLWLFLSYIYPIGNQIFGGVPYSFSYDTNYLIGYIGYPILGFIISFNSPSIRYRYLVTAWLLATTMLMIAIGYEILSFNLVYSYRSPIVLSYAVLGYLVIRQIPLASNLFMPRRVLGFLAPCTFGIYLLHPLILKITSLMPNFFPTGAIMGILARGACAFVFSALLIHWLRKTKFGRSVCP